MYFCQAGLPYSYTHIAPLYRFPLLNEIINTMMLACNMYVQSSTYTPSDGNIYKHMLCAFKYTHSLHFLHHHHHSRYLFPLTLKYSPQHPILKTLSLHSSLSMCNQVLHPHKTRGKIIVLYILILNFGTAN
jgi:hypothetical protein